MWEDRDICDGDRQCAQLSARAPARAVVVKHHHLYGVRRRTVTQPAEPQADRRVRAWITGWGKLVGIDYRCSPAPTVPVLCRAIIMDHDARCVIAVDTVGNRWDRQSRSGICFFAHRRRMAVCNAIWSRLNPLFFWLLLFKRRVSKS